MNCNCDPEKKLKFYPERSGALIDYRRVQIDSRHLIREGAGGRAARQASDCHCHKVTVDLRILLKGGAFFAAFILFLLSFQPNPSPHEELHHFCQRAQVYFVIALMFLQRLCVTSSSFNVSPYRVFDNCSLFLVPDALRCQIFGNEETRAMPLPPSGNSFLFVALKITFLPSNYC